MVCKYKSECKFHRSDNFPKPILLRSFRDNVCNYSSAEEYQRGLGYCDNPPLVFGHRFGENNCQLYLAWEENAQLKKQIADGGLEAKAKEDKRLEDVRLLGQIGLN